MLWDERIFNGWNQKEREQRKKKFVELLKSHSTTISIVFKFIDTANDKAKRLHKRNFIGSCVKPKMFSHILRLSLATWNAIYWLIGLVFFYWLFIALTFFLLLMNMNKTSKFVFKSHLIHLSATTKSRSLRNIWRLFSLHEHNFFFFCLMNSKAIQMLYTSHLYVSNSDDDYSVQLQSFNKTLWRPYWFLVRWNIRLILTSSFVSYIGSQFTHREREYIYVRMKRHKWGRCNTLEDATMHIVIFIVATLKFIRLNWEPIPFN